MSARRQLCPCHFVAEGRLCGSSECGECFRQYGTCDPCAFSMLSLALFLPTLNLNKTSMQDHGGESAKLGSRHSRCSTLTAAVLFPHPGPASMLAARHEVVAANCPGKHSCSTEQSAPPIGSCNIKVIPNPKARCNNKIKVAREEHRLVERDKNDMLSSVKCKANRTNLRNETLGY